jgi:predicted MFS family arabinose efflux permease
MRAVLAILAGIVVALAVQAGADYATSLIYPYPISDLWDREQVSEAMAQRPTAALLLTVLGYFLGALAGGVVGKLIARRGWASWVPAGVMAAIALLIALNYPLAEWAWFATFVAPLIGGLIANHLVAGRDTDAAPAAPAAEAKVDSGP